MSDEKRKLGQVYIINLDDELSIDDSLDIDLTKSGHDGNLGAFAVPYGSTSGCSDSCGSSTNCC